MLQVIPGFEPGICRHKQDQRSGIKYADPWYTMIQRVRATALDEGSFTAIS